jgi:hypothetical protein
MQSNPVVDTGYASLAPIQSFAGKSKGLKMGRGRIINFLPTEIHVVPEKIVARGLQLRKMITTW